MRFILNFIRTYLPAIVTGILIGTSYIPFQPWAIFFGLVPLFLFWSQTTSAKQAFIGGWVAQAILTLIGFHWVAYTAIEFGHFPQWAGVLALLGFAAIAHLHYAFAGALAVYLSRKLNIRGGWFFGLVASSFALAEGLYPMIFPWHLGYPWLWAKMPGAQLADVIGFQGLNLVTITINSLIAAAIAAGILVKSRDRVPTRRPFIYATVAALLFVVINYLGMGREKPWQQTDASANVLVVQGNIGNFEKLMAERGRNFRIPIVQKYIELTREGLSKNPESQLVVWPETAFPDNLDIGYQNDPSAATIRNYLIEAQVPLFTGAYSYDPVAKATYNAVFFVDKNGTTPEVPYRKSILLVFGETFPFSEYIPYTDVLFPGMGSFGRGQGPTVMSATVPTSSPELTEATLKIGPQICYEGLYPWFTSRLSSQGAQILMNVTNDSWFGRDFEPYQHLYMTLARAIEVRRPLVRSTNTGISTAVLASGEVLQKSPIGTEWVGMFKIPYKQNPDHTFYERFGGGWIGIVIAAFMLILFFGRSKEVDNRLGNAIGKLAEIQ